MDSSRRALAALLLAAPLLLSPLGCSPQAAVAPPETLPEGHPSMRQLWLDGRPVCLLERDGERYARFGRCSSAPPIEGRSPGDGSLPPGHPPVGPGSLEAPRGTVEI